MSAERTAARLLGAYPRAWRRRYGPELEALIVEASEGGRVGWRTRLDVLRAGGRERLRNAADGPLALLLSAWVLFVVGGLIVQRFAEHWQAATPDEVQALPGFAFAAFVAVAVCAALVIAAGAALAGPAGLAYLRRAGWARVRRQLAGPAALTALTVVATVALVVWAHGLGPHQREGGDTAYAAGFLLWATLACACLAGWAVAAVRIGRRLELPAPVLRTEARLSAALALAMAVATAALVVWWVALAAASRSFLAGSVPGGADSKLPAQLVVAVLLMAAATLLAGAGARRARAATAR